MDVLPFETYPEAVSHFGFAIPIQFYETLRKVEQYSLDNGYSIQELLFDLFNMLRIEGDEARYQQTPIELFPFSSTGSDGIHMGFVVHIEEQADYPTGIICPMDDEGVVLIGDNTISTFQNLLSTEQELTEQHIELITALNLDPDMAGNRSIDIDYTVRVQVPGNDGWVHIATNDGAGVLAEKKFFHDIDEFINLPTYRSDSFNEYMDTAQKMEQQGFYASQLFYLKELYWYEWTNYVTAKDLLKQMLVPYEKLNRQHLYEKTRLVIDKFDKKFDT